MTPISTSVARLHYFAYCAVPTLCTSSEAKTALVGFLNDEGPSNLTSLTAASRLIASSIALSILSQPTDASGCHHCSRHTQGDPSASSPVCHRSCRTPLVSLSSSNRLSRLPCPGVEFKLLHNFRQLGAEVVR